MRFGDVKMVCPVCIAGAVAGLAVAREFGISDLISGVWIGAITAASIFYVNNLMIRKYGKWHKYQTPILLVATLVILSIGLMIFAVSPSGTCLG
jgi:predicted transporter